MLIFKSEIYTCIMCIIVPEERYQGLQTWIQNSFRELHDIQAQKLAVAGVIVEEIRASIYNESGYRCSAGISQNKVTNNISCIHIIFYTSPICCISVTLALD